MHEGRHFYALYYGYKNYAAPHSRELGTALHSPAQAIGTLSAGGG